MSGKISTYLGSFAKSLFTGSLLLTCSFAYAGWTDVNGTGGIPTTSVGALSMTCDTTTGNLYIAFVDNSTSPAGRLTVIMYDATADSWTTLGTPGGVSSSTIRSPKIAMCAGSPPIVVFADGSATYSVGAKTWGSSTWTDIGPVSTSTNCDNISIYLQNATTYFVAYEDGSNSNKATVRQYSGGSWVGYGGIGFSTGIAQYTDITMISNGSGLVPATLFADGGLAGAPSAYYYNGSTFASLGSSLSSNTSKYEQIRGLGNNSQDAYAVVSDGGTDAFKDVLYKYDHTAGSWSPVITGPDPTFTADEADYNSMQIVKGNPVIAFSDKANGNKASVIRFTGTTYANVGAVGFSDGAASNVSMAVNKQGDLYVAYTDITHTTNNLVVKKMAHNDAVPTVPQNAKGLEIFPNPNSGSFTVKGDNGNYTIVNVLGQSIKTITLDANNNSSVTVSNLSNGVYFVKGANGLTKKVVVTK